MYLKVVVFSLLMLVLSMGVVSSVDVNDSTVIVDESLDVDTASFEYLSLDESVDECTLKDAPSSGDWKEYEDNGDFRCPTMVNVYDLGTSDNGTVNLQIDLRDASGCPLADTPFYIEWHNLAGGNIEHYDCTSDSEGINIFSKNFNSGRYFLGVYFVGDEAYLPSHNGINLDVGIQEDTQGGFDPVLFCNITCEASDFYGLSVVISHAKGKNNVFYLDHDISAINDELVININNDFVFDGRGHTIDLNGDNHYFKVNSNSVTFKNTRFINGRNDDCGKGGAIFFESSGVFTLINCTFDNCWADDLGGAVYSCGELYIFDSVFINNCADDDDGGAICAKNNVHIYNSLFKDNKACDCSGAIDVWGSMSEICGCVFENNYADDLGGAAWFKGNVNITNTTFKNNKADECGGAIYVEGSMSEIKDCIFENNCADDDDGGAICAKNNVHIYNSLFKDNKAGDCSGAVDVGGSMSEICGCVFENNYADDLGGAAWFKGDVNITNTTFRNNKADDCAGAIYVEGSMSEIKDCIFENNCADDNDGGAARFEGNVNITNTIFKNNKADDCAGAIDVEGSKAELTGCIFENNYAGNRGGAIFSCGKVYVDNCTINDNTAYFGGGIYANNNIYINNRTFDMESFFINNRVNYEEGCCNWGGAVYCCGNLFVNMGYFQGNKLELIGGAVYCKGEVNCVNSKFIRNVACRGGAVYCQGEVNCVNSTFSGNYANDDQFDSGGAVYFEYQATVINCNFINNSAFRGGAIYFWGTNEGTVLNCNFTDNSASDGGGAIYFVKYSDGTLTNCTFSNNTGRYGGAIYSEENSDGTLTNCNFINNTARYGGAIDMVSGTVSNCNFINNSVSGDGGAIYMDSGSVENCNFTDNEAYYGGAIRFNGEGTVTNCNFTGNNATTGSAIYFYSTSASKTVSNSRFLNNRANSDDLEVTKNDNNITITFTGNNNLLNAIYSRNDAEVTFTNVTYWGANGIANTGSSETRPSRSNKEAGQNITVSIVVNDKLVLNEVKVTDEYGMIVLPIIAGENYYISARHDTDSYYTEAEKTISNNTKFNVNITSQTTHNKTVNITAKSNIFSEVMDGKLLFIVPNSNPIIANYTGNGTWWIIYTFKDFADYMVNATYDGLDDVTINNATISITKVNSTLIIDNVVLDYGDTINVTVITEGATGITAKIDGSIVTVNEFTIPISDLNADNHILTVTTIPDEDHAIVTKTVNITVNKVNSTLTIDNIEINYGDNITVTTTGATGITAKINDNEVNVNEFTIITSDINVGNHTLTITTIPDENHNAVTKTVNITVNKVNSTLTLDNIEVNYGETKNITVTAEGAKGITARIDDKPVNVNEFTIKISGLNVGNHTLTVTTTPDENHNSVTKTVNITVNKVNSTLTLDNIEINYGETKTVDVITEGATGITTMIDGDEISVNEFTIKISGLNVGNHTLTVTTTPDENHNSVTKTVNITVNKINSTITLDNIEINYGETKNITVTTEGAKGITAKIDDNETSVNEFTIQITNLKLGNHTLIVTTTPDENHNPVTKTVTVTVNKRKPQIIVGSITTTYNINKDLVITIKGYDGELLSGVNITVDLNGVENYTTDENGQVKVPTLGLAPKTYIATITFNGNEDYGKYSTTVNVAVEKATATLTAENIAYVINYGGKYTVIIKDSNGSGVSKGKVTFVLNGENIGFATVNSKGVASITFTAKILKTAKAGTKNLKITFNSDYYNTISKTVNVKISKEKTKITAKKKTFKKAKKVKKYRITLKNSKGKAVKNVKVTLKIKGKKFNAKTNKKGKAVFKINKLTKKGTYKTKITFKGNEYYLKATKKVKIKLK